MSCTSLQTTRGAVTIRSTTADDAPRLRALRVEALASSPTSFGSDLSDVDAHDWVKVAAGDADNAVFVAEHASHLIGMTGAYRSTRRKERHHADLWGVYVRPDWRRMGLAQALVNAAVAWARDAGVVIVKLTVVPESGARACYERCGFKVTGVDPAALLWDGRYYDELLMHRWTIPNPLTGV